MTIQDMDPEEIAEIIETDTVRTAILTQGAVEKYKEQLDGCIAITVEGMTLRLNGFSHGPRAKAQGMSNHALP